MRYTFSCYGHENITATHPTTLMFTKDDFVTRRGDCIVGCRCDFELSELRKFIEKAEKTSKKVKMIIEIGSAAEELVGFMNPGFGDKDEMVIRKGDFLSQRTLMAHTDKSASDLPSDFRKRIQMPMKRVAVSIEPWSNSSSAIHP